VAAYEAVDRLIHPHTIAFLGLIALAGFIGFAGNESVAVFRIRVGRQINSAALIADGYHARTDGLTSLAVVVGAAGVYLGFPLADPIIGLLITLAIFAIVWQSAKAVFTRMLDGVEPEITAEIRHAAEHVRGIRQVLDVRARWIGHRLQAELDIAVDGNASVAEANTIAEQFESELFEHIPALAAVRIRTRPSDASPRTASAVHEHHGAGHHHAPTPVALRGELAEGVVEIIDTPAGERLQYTTLQSVSGLRVVVKIARDDHRVEVLVLSKLPGTANQFLSAVAPEEPHEFDAQLCLELAGRSEALRFHVAEPEGHGAH